MFILCWKIHDKMAAVNGEKWFKISFFYGSNIYSLNHLWPIHVLSHFLYHS